MVEGDDCNQLIDEFMASKGRANKVEGKLI